MIPQNQSILDNIHGNCFSACVASILELDLKDVPNFTYWPADDWWGAAQKWFRERQMTISAIHEPNHFPDDYWIAVGKSPRGRHCHAVVHHGRDLAHDPHPSRLGLDGLPMYCIVIEEGRP